MDSIKKYRSQNGLSQKELAKKVGVARILVTHWESDNCNGVSLSNAKKLSEIFDCSLFQLYGLNNFKIKPKSDEDKAWIIKLLFKTLKDEDIKGEVLEWLQQKK